MLLDEKKLSNKRKRAFTFEDDATIVTMLFENIKPTQIAKYLNRTEASILYRINKLKKAKSFKNIKYKSDFSIQKIKSSR